MEVPPPPSPRPPLPLGSDTSASSQIAIHLMINYMLTQWFLHTSVQLSFIYCSNSLYWWHILINFYVQQVFLHTLAQQIFGLLCVELVVRMGSLLIATGNCLIFVLCAMHSYSLCFFTLLILKVIYIDVHYYVFIYYYYYHALGARNISFY